jgi:hypothetical protein
VGAGALHPDVLDARFLQNFVRFQDGSVQKVVRAYSYPQEVKPLIHF